MRRSAFAFILGTLTKREDHPQGGIVRSLVVDDASIIVQLAANERKDILNAHTILVVRKYEYGWKALTGIVAY